MTLARIANCLLAALLLAAAGAGPAGAEPQERGFDFSPLLGYEQMSCGAGYVYDPAVRDCIEMGVVISPTPTGTPTPTPYPTTDPCIEFIPNDVGAVIEIPPECATPAGVDMVPGSSEGPRLPILLAVLAVGVVTLLIWARRGRRS